MAIVQHPCNPRYTYQQDLRPCVALGLLTGSCVARRTVIQGVVASGAGLLSVTLPNVPAVSGNSKVPRQQVERFKRGRRHRRHADRYRFAGWNCVACDGRGALVDLAPVPACLTDQQ